MQIIIIIIILCEKEQKIVVLPSSGISEYLGGQLENIFFYFLTPKST